MVGAGYVGVVRVGLDPLGTMPPEVVVVGATQPPGFGRV